MDPYRTIEASCDICWSSVAADELKELYTLKICRACVSRKNDELLERQGYKLRITNKRISSDYFHFVEITQEIDLSIVVNFNREGIDGKLLGLIGKGDHKIGHKEFDGAVNLEVDDEYYPIVDTALERQGVREVVMALLESGRENQVQLINTITSARWVSEHVIESEYFPPFDLKVLVLACLMRRIDRELKGAS